MSLNIDAASSTIPEQAPEQGKLRALLPEQLQL